jgi:hypothetical protein
MTKTNDLNRAEAQRELDQRKLAHDFANEGDCLYCGDLAVLIDQGQIKPCFQWERPNQPEPIDD